MADDIYTHNFDFTVGSKFIRGEMEFDTDEKMSYKIKETSDPFSNEFLHFFQELMDYLFILYNQQGEIKKITIKRKE
jgi:hypothetical protein